VSSSTSIASALAIPLIRSSDGLATCQEDIVQETLHSKIKLLQEQVDTLVEARDKTNIRYRKIKEDNALLTARIHMLEEHVREVETRAEQKLEEEQRRNGEIVRRKEREKQMELEHYNLKLQAAEKENRRNQEAVTAATARVEEIKMEKALVEERLVETTNLWMAEQEQSKSFRESVIKETQCLNVVRETACISEFDLAKKIDGVQPSWSNNEGKKARVEGTEEMKTEMVDRIAQMENEIQALKESNEYFRELNGELQGQMLNTGVGATRSPECSPWGIKTKPKENVILRRSMESSSGFYNVEDVDKRQLNLTAEDNLSSDYQEGKTRPCSQNKGVTCPNNNLASEFEAMSENEMRIALKDQQDANVQLRNYIDSVLMNILEKRPELLEITSKKQN